MLYAPLNYISHCSYLISAWRPLPLRIFSLLQAPIRTPRPRRTVRGLVRRHRVLSRIREVRTKTTTRCSKLEIQAVLFLCYQRIRVHTNFLFNLETSVLLQNTILFVLWKFVLCCVILMKCKL